MRWPEGRRKGHGNALLPGDLQASGVHCIPSPSLPLFPPCHTHTTRAIHHSMALCRACHMPAICSFLALYISGTLHLLTHTKTTSLEEGGNIPFASPLSTFGAICALMALSRVPHCTPAGCRRALLPALPTALWPAHTLTVWPAAACACTWHFRGQAAAVWLEKAGLKAVERRGQAAVEECV